MLLYGDDYMLQFIDTNDFVIYNYSAFCGRFRDLGLIPPNNLGACTEYDFDCRYASWILSNDGPFCSMMQIVIDIFNNKNVFILINTNFDWSISLIQSFLKLLQQRYGINGTYVADHDDIATANETEINPYFVSLLSEDNERYVSIMEYARIASGGRVYEE